MCVHKHECNHVLLGNTGKLVISRSEVRDARAGNGLAACTAGRWKVLVESVVQFVIGFEETDADMQMVIVFTNCSMCSHREWAKSLRTCQCEWDLWMQFQWKCCGTADNISNWMYSDIRVLIPNT